MCGCAGWSVPLLFTYGKSRFSQDVALLLSLYSVLQHSSIYGPRQANLVLIAYASSEGSGEPAHPRSLARTSAARSYKQWVKRNLQEARSLAPLNGWACAVKICHDGMLEDTNSLDGAHMYTQRSFAHSPTWSKKQAPNKLTQTHRKHSFFTYTNICMRSKTLKIFKTLRLYFCADLKSRIKQQFIRSVLFSCSCWSSFDHVLWVIWNRKLKSIYSKIIKLLLILVAATFFCPQTLTLQNKMWTLLKQIFKLPVI